MIPRLVATLLPDADVPPLGERVWGDTRIELPADSPARYRHVLTNGRIPVRRDGHHATLWAADGFAQFPIALLEAQ